MKFDELTAAERLIAEQAVLNLRSLNKACDNSADGTVLAIGEVMAVEQGRRFTQKTLQAAMDEQIKTLEKTFARPVLHLWVEKGSPRSQGSSPDHSGGRRATVSDLSEVCSL